MNQSEIFQRKSQRKFHRINVLVCTGKYASPCARKREHIMNSTNHKLTALDWTYEGHVTTAKATGFQGKGMNRTLFLYPKIEDVPAELFACKVSQSPKPERSGKLVFKYLGFRFEPNAAFNDLAPAAVTMQTELEEIKNIVIANLANIPTAEVSLSVKLHGKWKNIVTADSGVNGIVLFNDDAPELQNADPMKNGEPSYYIKKDAIINVHLQGQSSQQGNDWIASDLSTTATTDTIMQMKGAVGAIWSPEGNTIPTATAPTTPIAGTSASTSEAPDNGVIW